MWGNERSEKVSLHSILHVCDVAAFYSSCLKKLENKAMDRWPEMYHYRECNPGINLTSRSSRQCTKLVLGISGMRCGLEWPFMLLTPTPGAASPRINGEGQRPKPHCSRKKKRG